MKKVAIAVFAVLIMQAHFGVSCNAACPVDHFNLAHEAARQTLGDVSGPRMGYLPSEVLNSENPDNSIQILCKRVSDAMRMKATEPDSFAIASVDDSAALRLLTCISELNEGVKLPFLRLVYVGKPESGETARKLVESWGTEFHFVSDERFRIETAASCKGNVAEYGGLGHTLATRTNELVAGMRQMVAGRRGTVNELSAQQLEQVLREEWAGWYDIPMKDRTEIWVQSVVARSLEE